MDDLRKLCEGKVLFEEVLEVFKIFEDNKVFGNDGFLVEFYKIFWYFLGDSLVVLFNIVFEVGSMFIF